MKKLLQLLIVSVMAVSCLFFAISCSGNSGNGSGDDSVTCEHDYKDTVVAATCTTGGYTEHTCSKCGETYKDNEVAALGHDMTEWAEKTAATCVDAQVMERHCQRTGCTEAETQDGTPALGHEMEWTTTLEPTCTTDGKKDGECKRVGCDHVESDVVIAKLNHHYVEPTDDEKAKAATCTEDGLEVKICDNPGCGDRKETTIPALGHTPDGTKAEVTAPTCTEQGYTTYHCETCRQDYKDDYVNARNHDMALTETVGVTCLTDGYELWECQRDNCDHSERREVVDKLDHEFDDDGNCTKGCGKNVLTDSATWFTQEVTCTEVAKNSFDFTTDDKLKAVLTFNKNALTYLKNAGYTILRITYYGKNGVDMNLNISKDNTLPNSGWTNKAGALSRDFEINDELSVLKTNYAIQDGIDGFNLKFKVFRGYEDSESWFASRVTCEKVGEDSFDFTATDARQWVLDFNQNALSYLKSQGYTHIRITYYGKNGADMNLAISKDNNLSGWTNNAGAKSQDFAIDEVSKIQTNYAAKEGIDGFNFKFKAINHNKAENWFNALVPCEKVGDNSFDFTATNARQWVLEFNKYALSYLKSQGYTHIRITYYGKNGADMNLAIAKDNNLSGWTNNAGAKSQDFAIDEVSKIQTNYAEKAGIDGFNFIIEAITKTE